MNDGFKNDTNNLVIGMKAKIAIAVIQVELKKVEVLKVKIRERLEVVVQ